MTPPYQAQQRRRQRPPNPLQTATTVATVAVAGGSQRDSAHRTGSTTGAAAGATRAAAAAAAAVDSFRDTEWRSGTRGDVRTSGGWSIDKDKVELLRKNNVVSDGFKCAIVMWCKIKLNLHVH